MAVATDKVVISELLCFLANKCGQVSFDKLVKIASSFYNWDEIAQAKGQVLADVRAACPDVEGRLPKRKGADKEKSTVSDLLKCLLDPKFQPPKYVALNLSRVPPIGMEDVDAVTVCNELAVIKLQIKELIEWKVGLGDGYNACGHSPGMVNAPVVVADTNASGDKPSFTVGDGNTVTFAKVAAEGGVSGNSLIRKYDDKNKKSVRKINTGKAPTSSLRVAIRRKSLDLYVSGLQPDESAERVQEVVKGKLPALEVDVSCEKLKSRGPHYSSFHVKVQGVDELVKQASSILESEDTWDEGIIFRRFWIKRPIESNPSA